MRHVLGLIALVGLFGAGPESIPIVATDGPDRAARQPQAAVFGRGRVAVVFGVGNTIRCVVSRDGGHSFGEPVTVGAVPALALGMRRGPRVAATGRAIVVTVVGGQVGKGRDGDVLAWRSTDGGSTWSGPSRVNGIAGSAREGLHGMAAGLDGTVFCAWLDLRNRKTEIFGARSPDGGSTWEPDRLIYQSPDGSVCECCHPSVAVGAHGEVAVMWRNQLGGARDLFLARSRDGGATFGPAEKLGRGTWPLDICPMDGGAVALGPRGEVATAWRRDREVFTAAPGEAERLLGRGTQPWLALGPDGVYSVWLERRPGRLMVALPSQPPRAWADEANDPVIVAGPNGEGPVVVVWEAKAGGLYASALAPPR